MCSVYNWFWRGHAVLRVMRRSRVVKRGVGSSSVGRPHAFFSTVELTDGPFKRGDPQRGQGKRKEESPGGWIQRVPWVIALFSIPVGFLKIKKMLKKYYQHFQEEILS